MPARTPDPLAPVDGPDPVNPADIRAAFAALRVSDALRTSPQLVAFLEYAVERTLAGDPQSLKGYTIATQVFGRPDSFDPSTDPIVRVEARRLRQALASHYDGPGASDPVRILLPVGTYIPVFERVPEGAARPNQRPDTQADPVADRIDLSPTGWPLARIAGYSLFAPLLAAIMFIAFAFGRSDRPVRETEPASQTEIPLASAPAQALPDRTFARLVPGEIRLPTYEIAAVTTLGAVPVGETLSQSMADHLRILLARFDNIRVLGPRAGTAAQDDADFRLISTIRWHAADRVTVTGQTVEASSGEVVAAREFAGVVVDRAPRTPDEVSVASMLERVAVAMAQPYGTLTVRGLAEIAAGQGRPGLSCIYAAEDYWRRPSRVLHGQVRDCLERSTPIGKAEALYHTHLSFLALDEQRSGFNRRSAPALDTALHHARRAVESNPSSARAHQALMDALFVRRDFASALEAGERAIELNPIDPDIRGDYAARLIQLGNVDRGLAMMIEATRMSPARPGWQQFHLFLGHFMHDERDLARQKADSIAPDALPLGPIAKAIVASWRSDRATIAAQLDLLDRDYPEFRTQPRAALDRRVFAPVVLDRLTDAVKAAQALVAGP